MGAPTGRSSGGGSTPGSAGRPAPHLLSDFLPPGLQQDAWQIAGRQNRRGDGLRRQTLFEPAAGTPDTPAHVRPGSARASPSIYPSGSDDLLARCLAAEEMMQQQAAALYRQDAELQLLRSGGPAPSPAGLAAASPPSGSAADDAVAVLAAKVDEQQRLIERLLHQQQQPSPEPPAGAESGVPSLASKPGARLRGLPEFLAMALVPTSTADDVARMVRVMLEAFGTIADGDAFQELILWVFKLPANDSSSVPAVATAAVDAFCTARGLPLTSAGVSLTQGADCFGTGKEASHRRLVFVALLSAVSERGSVLSSIDRELLISFRPRLRGLRLSETDLASPSFVALLATVLHFVNHGPASVLASVVAALFTCAPPETLGAVNHQIRCFETDLASKLRLFAELAKYPCLLPALLAAAVVPTADGAAGAAFQRVVNDVLDLAAEPSTDPADLVRFVTESTHGTGTVGSQVISWTPAVDSPFLRLLTTRQQAQSASPAAASLSPAKQAPSKSAPRPPRPVAKSQYSGGPQQPCPHGVDCATHGALYGHCKFSHSEEVDRAIKDRLRATGIPFFTKRGRAAVHQQVAAQGGPPGGGGGGGQPTASPSPSAAAAPAPTPPPVPPASAPAAPPSPPVPAAPLAAASAAHMAALAQFLGSVGTPGFVALGVPGVAAPPALADVPVPAAHAAPATAAPVPVDGPAFANVPVPAAPVALAAAAPASADGPPDAPVWGGSDPRQRLLCVDSGSKHPYAPNTAGAPTRRVPGEKCVTSTGALSVTDREFAATVYLQDVKGRFYAVVLGNIREQPGLVLPPSAPGGQAVPVMLVDLTSIAGSGGVLHAEGQWASDSPSEEATVQGYVRLRVHEGCDLRVEPHGKLTDRIPGVFHRGIFELPTVALPAGAVPVPVVLGRPSAALSASSVALTAPERQFGSLLRLCQVWHSGAASLVPAYAASSPAEQAAYMASNGGLDPAAQLRLGMSLFSSCLADFASEVLRDIGVSVPSCSAASVGASAAAGAAVSSALSSPAMLAAGSPGVQPAPSALAVLLDLVRRSPAVVPPSGAVPVAAPPASSPSSSSLLSPQ